MMGNDSRELDLVAELRLRQWARRNYVPATARQDSDWHAVVINEMRRMDRDQDLIEATQSVVTSAGVVSLEPSLHQAIRIDEPHAEIPAPKMHFIRPAASQVNSVIPRCV
jgi:hypothetical protein